MDKEVKEVMVLHAITRDILMDMLGELKQQLELDNLVYESAYHSGANLDFNNLLLKNLKIISKINKMIEFRVEEITKKAQEEYDGEN